MSDPNGKVSISIPAVVAIAAVTALSNFAARACSPSESGGAELQRDVQAIRVDMAAIRAEQRALLERINRSEEQAANAALVESLRGQHGRGGL